MNSQALSQALEELRKEAADLQKQSEVLEQRRAVVDGALKALLRLRNLETSSPEIASAAASLSTNVARSMAERFSTRRVAPPRPPWLEAADDSEAEDEPNGDLDLDNPFHGMRFSQALHKFMRGNSPMSTTDIARRFAEAGWKFKSSVPPAQVNQVGVTLRRFKGKLFGAQPDGRWVALEGNVEDLT